MLMINFLIKLGNNSDVEATSNEVVKFIKSPINK